MKLGNYQTNLIICTVFMITSILPIQSQRWSGNTLYDLEGNGADFTTLANKWTASSLMTAGKKVYSCAGVDLLGGYGIVGIGAGYFNQYLERTYTGLPSHNQILLNFTVYALDNWVGIDNDHFDVLIDGITLSSWGLYHGGIYGAYRCGSMANTEAPPFLTVISVPHNQTSVKIRIKNIFINIKDSYECSLGVRDLIMKLEVVKSPLKSLCGIGTSTVNIPCSCGASQYMSPISSGNCSDCNSACASCSGPSSSECTGCAAGKYLRNNMCNDCHSSCATCDGPLATDCLTCPSDAFMVDTSCTPYCPLPFYSTLVGSNNICKTSCPGEFIYKDGACSPNCSSPYSPFYTLSLKACVCYNEIPGGDCYACDSSCLTCRGQADTQCQTCSDGHFFSVIDSTANTGRCNSCDPTCLTCTGPAVDQCLTCDTDRFFMASSGNATLGTCQSCDTSCLTCNGPQSNQCLTCDTDHYLISDSTTGGGTCGACHSSCASCDGPTANNCLSCDSGSYLVNNNTCTSSCPSPLFVTSNGRKDFCESPCTVPLFSFAFESGLCKPSCDTLYKTVVFGTLKACYCTDYEYWNRSCLATCDFPLSSRTQGTRKFCDFSCGPLEYLNDNGTCATSCEFPTYPDSRNGNLFCRDLNCETMKIKYIKPTTDGYEYRLQFSPESCDFPPAYLQGLFTTNEVANAVLKDFAFTVIRIQGNLYQVNLALSQSILEDTTLDFRFSTLSSQMIVFTKFVPSEFAKTIVSYAQKAQTSVVVATGVAIATTVFIQATTSVWGFVGFQQLINYLKYINVEYPYQMETLFVLGGGTNFGSLPNVIDDWTQESYDRYATNEDLVDYQTPPRKFSDYGETSYFIKNGGSIMLMNFLTLLVLILIILLSKAPKIRNNKIFVSIDGLMRWNFKLRAFMTTFLPLTVAICLQLRTMTFEGGYLAICSSMTIISMLYALALCSAMLKILHSRTPDELNNKEYQKVYGTLTKGITVKTKSSKYYYMLIMLRGIVVSLLIVFAEAIPLLQISTLVLFSIGLLYYLITKMTFTNKKERTKTLTTETLLIPTQALISLLTFKNQSEAYYQAVGWILVGIIGVIFINEFIFIVTVQYEAIKQALEVIRARFNKKPSAKLDTTSRSPTKLENKSGTSASALNLGPTIVNMTSALNEEPVIGIDLDATPADNINSIPFKKVPIPSKVKPIQHCPKLRVIDLDLDSSNPRNLGMASNFQDHYPSAMNEEDPSVFTQREIPSMKDSSPASKMRSLKMENFKENLHFSRPYLMNSDGSPTNQSKSIINGPVIEEKDSVLDEEDSDVFTQRELFPKKSSSPVSKMRSLSSPYFLNMESFKKNFTSELTNRDDSPTNQSKSIINGTVVEEKNSVLDEEDISTNRELITPNLLKLDSMKSNGSTTPRESRKGNTTPKSKSKSLSLASPIVVKIESNKKIEKLG